MYWGACFFRKHWNTGLPYHQLGNPNIYLQSLQRQQPVIWGHLLPVMGYFIRCSDLLFWASYTAFQRLVSKQPLLTLAFKDWLLDS